MARRRYRKITSGSGKSHQGRRITMAQPVSSILGDVVKSSRSIAHSDDFEGHKLLQTNSRQLILLDLHILYWDILMSCVAWPNQTPIGTASNFLQCKWVSCSKSYWQGYDLGWYKDMGAPCFPQPNLWLARCAAMSWTALKKFVVLSTQELHGIKPFHCGRIAWQVLSVLRLRCLLCLFRLAPSCRLRRLARWCEMAQMVSTATQPRYASTMFHSNQPETFPLSAGVSRPCLPSAPNKATESVIFCFGKMFARAAAAAGGSSSSSRRKQQQQEAAAAAGAGSSSRRKQQQEAAAAGGGSSSSSRQKQQQQAAAAACSRQAAAGKQQQASSSRQAAGGSSSRRQQHKAAAARGGSSNSSRKQQQQQASSSSRQAAAAGKQQQASSSSRQAAAGKQQQGSSSRQAAAASSMQQASSSRQAAAGKQQPASSSSQAAAAASSSSSKQQQ